MYVRRAGVRQPAGARRAGGPDSAERTSPLYQNVRRASTALYVSCTCPVRLIMYINVVVQQQEMTRHRPHMGTAPDPRPPAARPRHAPAPGRTRIACDAHRSPPHAARPTHGDIHRSSLSPWAGRRPSVHTNGVCDHLLMRLRSRSRAHGPRANSNHITFTASHPRARSRACAFVSMTREWALPAPPSCPR